MHYIISTKYKRSWLIVNDIGIITETGEAFKRWIGANISSLIETLSTKNFPLY